MQYEYPVGHDVTTPRCGSPSRSGRGVAPVLCTLHRNTEPVVLGSNFILKKYIKEDYEQIRLSPFCSHVLSLSRALDQLTAFLEVAQLLGRERSALLRGHREDAIAADAEGSTLCVAGQRRLRSLKGVYDYALASCGQ